MNPKPKHRATSRFLLPALVLAAAGLALAAPLPVLAGTVELATSPMTTSTSTTVKPNLMFMLDDSGSMAWDYLPDTAKSFSGKYGYNSANCNGAAYNPNTTYSPPVNSTGAPLNAVATTFAAAYKDGYVTGSGTTDLNTAFTGGSGSGSSGISLTPGPAFYYTYTGTQNTTALQNYFNTSSTFYLECNSNVGSTPGSGVFTLTRLASVPTTTITVTGIGASGTPASIKITNSGSSSKPASISDVIVTLSGGSTIKILKATTSTTKTAKTLAGYLVSGINACTANVGATGNCPAGGTGYSAAIDAIDNTKVNITGPASSVSATLGAPGAATMAAAVVFVSGTTGASTNVNFPGAPANSDTTSVSVGGINLLNNTATANTPNTMATAISTQINAKTATTGYSATASNNVVTITGPSAAANLTPVLTLSGTSLALATVAFPDSTPAKLQNFANWYSYYSNRMLMMKTGAGLAFNNVSDKFRVGFITMNNNVSPGIVEANTFDANQRLAWFNKLYASVPANTTPLREILSRVGQYYAHKFGAVTTYKATITVGGSGDTSVSSATTNSVEMMDDSTDVFSTTAALASAITDQINAPQVTDFGASVNGNVITILGPATSAGFTPVVTGDGGGMTFARTAFTGTTVTSQLNGITPADPIQYSCQQNFVILSTDGYWNGSTTYDLNGSTVGNVDALAARPYNDGGQNKDTITISYSANLASSVPCSPTVSGWTRIQTQPRVGSCAVTLAAGANPTGTESCSPSNWTNAPAANPPTFGACTHVSPSPLPAPNPTTQVETGRVVVVGTNAGVSDTLADVALYYYQTDLRDNNLGNCTGALGTSVCQNDVFQSGSDNNLQQHMTTFTLGLGVRGQMVYSSGYLTDTTGDFVAVKLGTTANSGSIVVSGSGSTSVSSITVGTGGNIMSGPSTASTSTSTVAANIAAKITLNGYTATATGSTVNLSGPSSDAGKTLTITIVPSGTMVLTAAAGTGICSWQASGTVCNWPVPVSGTPTTVDDLWHAAVNGRGAYFSATDPDSLANGLANALTSISSKVGAAAAAATSTLNPVAGNNQAFVASYTTLTWQGNLEARGINTSTGVVNQNANWCVENVAADACVSPGVVTADSSGDTTSYTCVTPNQVTCVGGALSGTNCAVPIATACTGTMNSMAFDNSDGRTILTANNAGTALINFDDNYHDTHTAYFDATVAAKLTQWPVATDVSSDSVYFRANAYGRNLLRFLRGRHGHETGRSSVANVDQFYRNRVAVLGDALESQPAFIGAPIFNYPYPGYQEFIAVPVSGSNPGGQGNRVGTVYMGTNDGMMHAFASDTGIERWAYVPSMVIPGMWKLADLQYSGLHTNYVNGSPVTTDICTARCANAFTSGSPSTSPVWKTIMVSGLNGGGRGYFALDITDPTNPSLLWEFTVPAANGGIGIVQDPDLGYTFGQPVVTRKSDGTWVVLVTSGYDNGTDSAAKASGSFVGNAPPGSGEGYLYVLNAGTGAIISKISTGAGTPANPSGLAKIAGYNIEAGGNTVSYVYGGDLLGNLWRFDVNAATSASAVGTNTVGNGTVLKFATLFSDTAATLPQPIMTTPILGTILGKRIIFIGTGKYLEVADLSNTQKMSQYAIKDDDATATFVNPRTSLIQQFLINNPDGTATRLSAATAAATTAGSNAVDFGTGRGWFLDFPDSRERVNIDAKLVLGTLVVPSIVPSSTDCSPGGTGWLNFFDYKTGGPINATPGISGVKYDSTIVGVNVLFINGNPVVEVVTSSDPTPTKDPNVQFKATSAGFAGKRVMWRELIPTD